MYQVIYADPPWNYRDQCNSGKRGAIHKYQTMKLPQIKALPVNYIAAKNSILFMWVTAPMFPEGLEVVKAWGFKFKTVGFTWVKTTSKIACPSAIARAPDASAMEVFTDAGLKLAVGMGHYSRANAEFCLIGIKGRFKRVDGGVQSAIIAPRRAHSQKPDEARDRIVRLTGDVPRIELFARVRVDGWDAWGNEIRQLDIFLDPFPSGTLIGDNFEDFPEPHFMRSFVEPRRVLVSVTKYDGVGLHYHTMVTENEDSFWDFKRGIWRQPWRSPYRGKHFSQKFRTHKEAKGHVQRMVDEHFSTAAHDVRNRHTDERWYYREGD